MPSPDQTAELDLDNADSTLSSFGEKNGHSEFNYPLEETTGQIVLFSSEEIEPETQVVIPLPETPTFVRRYWRVQRRRQAF